MMGIAYTTAIDMWSLGCIVFECLVGIPLFAGENERDQMLSIMEVTGLPPRSLIAQATRRKVFFDDDYNPIIRPNSRGKVRKPGSKPLDMILKVADPDLVSFLTVRMQNFLFSVGMFRVEARQEAETNRGITASLDIKGDN